MNSAAVVGAQEVIERYIVEKLTSLPDWQVTGLSRRTHRSLKRPQGFSFPAASISGPRISIGTGNTMVELLSPAIWVSVCR